MKKLQYLILVVLICIAITSNGNAQSISRESVVGNWIFDYDASLGLSDDEARSFYDGMANDRKEQIKGAYEDRRITFFGDGRFLQELQNGKVQDGTWVLERGNKISVSDASGYTISFVVKNAGGDILIIMPQKSGGDSANMLFSQWYLTKG